MKGLYVYGALTMALSFTVGVQSGNGWLMALSLAAALSAAGAEAAAEAYHEADIHWMVIPGNILALASWVLAATAGFYAITVLVI